MTQIPISVTMGPVFFFFLLLLLSPPLNIMGPYVMNPFYCAFILRYVMMDIACLVSNESYPRIRELSVWHGSFLWQQKSNWYQVLYIKISKKSIKKPKICSPNNIQVFFRVQHPIKRRRKIGSSMPCLSYGFQSVLIVSRKRIPKYCKLIILGSLLCVEQFNLNWISLLHKILFHKIYVGVVHYLFLIPTSL